MNPSVWAIVVTFNRQALLAQCIAALQAQTRPCDRILIIDNASADGTEAWLAEVVGDRVSAYRVSRNTGGAGGFNAGMRLAYQGGADLLWLMDDDVIARPDALQALIQAREELQARGVEPAFVASTAWTPEGLVTNVPDVDHRQNAIQYSNWPLHLDLTLAPVRRATFVSIMFSRSVVEAHGLPIAPMFIWGDDSEYTVRVTTEKPGFLVGKSSVLHVRAAPGVLSLQNEDNPIRMGFHRYLTRNTAYLVRTHYGRKAWLQYSWGQIQDAARLVARGQLAKARILASGVWDGARFRPKVERGTEATSQLGAELTPILASRSPSRASKREEIQT